jgi:hypothetical protein
MSAEPIAAVLHHVADVVEGFDSNRRARPEQSGAGGMVFQQAFESAKTLYAAPALLHLEQHLGIVQVQHWDAREVGTVAEQLRAAAGARPDVGVETAALLRQLQGFHRELAAAAGTDEVSTGALLNEITRRVERMQVRAERAEQQLAECRRELAQARQQLKARPTVTVQAPLFELETSR